MKVWAGVGEGLSATQVPEGIDTTLIPVFETRLDCQRYYMADVLEGNFDAREVELAVAMRICMEHVRANEGLILLKWDETWIVVQEWRF